MFDYVTGKVNWLANGLPTEGKEAHVLRAQNCVRRDMPTCRLTDHLRDIRRIVQAAGQLGCVVVNEAGVVLGYIDIDALDAAPETTADKVMDPGPSTIRPHLPLEDTTAYLQEKDLDSILVTTADGQLIGMLYRQDAEQMRG